MTKFVYTKCLNKNVKMAINADHIVKIEEPNLSTVTVSGCRSRITLITGHVVDTDVDVLSWKEQLNYT